MRGSIAAFDGDVTSMRAATFPRMKAATTVSLTDEFGGIRHEPDADSGIPGMVAGDPVGVPPAEMHRSAASAREL